MTQDGPSHLYNAQILARSLDPASPFRNDYTVRWEPLPNWAGHLTLMGLVSILPARAADRAMMSITLVGLAASIAWLRVRVAGWRGMPTAALLAVLLALNVTWLLGFGSFLLGCCLFPITLAVWWKGREGLRPARVLGLAALVVLGYFGHPVSLGLTVIGLAVLAVFSTGPRRLARVAWTAASVIPLIPLAVIYRRLTRHGGKISPEWEHLTNPLSLRSWAAQLGWIDPISLGSKMIAPFCEQKSLAFGLLAPVVWLMVALILGGYQTYLAPSRAEGRRGWLVLAGLLFLGGLVGPDSLGASHGQYLQQRIVLLGLVALVPALELEAKGWAGRGCCLALWLAVAFQSAYVWDYALNSQRQVGALMGAREAVGRNQRVATLLINIRGRYRANPLMHADNLLGVDTGNIVWNNYETGYYYFPVTFRAGLDHPDAAELEKVAIRDDPADKDARAAAWSDLLSHHHQSIDVLVVWGSDPQLDAINNRWFEPAYHQGKVRVLRHQGARPRD